MVKLYTKKDSIDFEAPIYMDEDYFKKFCNFLENLTGDKIEIINVHEKERFDNPNKTEKHTKRWEANELL